MVGVIAALVAVMVLLGFFFWLPSYLRRNPAKRPRASSPTSGLLASAEEAWHPTGSAEQRLLDEQQHWVEPAPTPDGDNGVGDTITPLR